MKRPSLRPGWTVVPGVTGNVPRFPAKKVPLYASAVGTM